MNLPGCAATCLLDLPAGDFQPEPSAIARSWDRLDLTDNRGDSDDAAASASAASAASVSAASAWGGAYGAALAGAGAAPAVPIPAVPDRASGCLTDSG